ncbi:hypothetical protein V6N13_102416 [Hibiscus sabdariffa]|uniref:Pentatricopeptide repeat-containing protein n=1 Tax=Hibiscus sabdariffa TaxID=183260 RepID=A0ABR2D3Z9_9ROSI
MVQMDLIPNVVTYTALADGLCKSGNITQAITLSRMKDMEIAGLLPNVITYTTLTWMLTVRQGIVKKGAWFLRRETIDVGYGI